MKKKKILLIILPIVLILIIVAVLAVLYFMTDTFKGNDELFAKYFSQNGEILSILQNENTEAQKTFKSNNTYTMSGDLSATIQDGTNTQELVATTAGRHDTTTGRTYSEITLKNGEVDTLKVSYINSDDVYAVKCDDIMPNYIGIRNSELKKFAQSMGMSESNVQNIPDNIVFSAIGDITNITDEQKQHIIDTYSKIITDSISVDKYTKLNKMQISVDGTSYEANAYRLTMDETTLKQLIINCLTTLKDDNITLAMVSNKISSIGIETEYTDITKLSETIENLITQIQNSNEVISDTVSITVYENKGNTVRTEISIGDTNKITIDKITGTNSSKAIVTVESDNDETNNITDTMTNEIGSVATVDTIETATSGISQITLQKNVSDAGITNTMTFIPDTNNMAQLIEINTTMGKLVDNTISSSSDITLSISSDGINVQTIQTSYTQNIQATTEVEEIMELKNSNTVIVNNYTKEQLTPFLTQIVEKISEVIPNKLGQLGINVSTNQSN